MSKCFYMHFQPNNKNETTKLDKNCNLVVNNHIIKKVSSTKFLGVTIDDKLNWDIHISDCKRKLNYATATLSRIRKCIPADLHEDLYYTLF